MEVSPQTACSSLLFQVPSRMSFQESQYDQPRRLSVLTPQLQRQPQLVLSPAIPALLLRESPLAKTSFERRVPWVENI